MTVTRGLTWALVAGATLLVGCDFFSPRSAEPPADTSRVCRTSRREADSLFTDLKCSMGAKSNGEPLYEDLLDEEFLFYMDPQEAVSVGPPASWNKLTESQFLASTNSKVDSVRVEFPSIEPGGTGQDAAFADTAHFVCSYSIFTSPIDSPDSTIFAGTADITFRKPSGTATWAILRWVDHKASGFRTLGILRRS